MVTRGTLLGVVALTVSAAAGVWHGLVRATPAGAPRQPRIDQRDRAVASPPQTDDPALVRSQPMTAPKLVVAEQNLKRRAETTPGSPMYRPYKLRRVMSTASVFDHEPRDPRWAQPLEDWLSSSIRADFQAVLGQRPEISVACRSSVCRIELLSTDVRFDAFETMILGTYTPSVSYTTTSDRALYMMFAETGPFANVPVGDPDATLAKLTRKRQALIQSRSGTLVCDPALVKQGLTCPARK